MSTTFSASAPAANAAAGRHAAGASAKYLTFRIGAEEYGVEILKVREIIGIIDITGVPKMPPAMKGVINLRGKVIPVIDLRLQFGLEEIPYTELTCIVVVDVGREFGIIVDTVSEVLDIAQSNVEPPPSLDGALSTSFILGLGKVGEAVKILLDIDRVLSTHETVAASNAAREAATADTSKPAAASED